MSTTVVSTFDTDADGWTMSGDVASDAWVSTGGDPGGFFHWVDAATGAYSYFDAPAKFIGDQAVMFGGRLTYNLQDTGNDINNVPDIILTGDGITLDYMTAGTPGLTPAWGQFAANLTGSGWTVDGAGTAATDAQMKAVLGDLTQMLIRAEYVDGDETGGVDNVKMTSVPAAAPTGTDIWTGNGDWNANLSHWSLGVAPTTSNDALIQNGTVALSTSGAAHVVTVNANATFNMTSASALTAAGLTNFGQMNFATTYADGGENIAVSGTFANYGGLVLGVSNLSASTTMTVGRLALRQSGDAGTINLWGNQTLGTTKQTSLIVQSAAPTTLNGSIYLHGDSDLEFASGGITTIGTGVEFQIDGQQSRASIGAGTTNSALTSLATNLGVFDLEGDWDTGPGGTSVTTNVALLNTGALDVDVYYADGASKMTVGGLLTNVGAVVVGNSALSAGSSLTVSALNNIGTINLWGAETLGTTEQATFHVAGAGPSTVTGKIFIHGDSLFEYDSGGITTVGAGAELQIDGKQSRFSIGAGTTNSALNQFAANYGIFDEEGDWNTGPGGATVNTSAAFANFATFQLDVYNADGASSFTDTGSFTNNASVQVGNSNLSANSTLTVGSLANTGEVYVVSQSTGGAGQPQAAFNVLSAAPAASAGYLRVAGDAQIDFKSGAITSISTGAEIEIDGGAASIAIGTTGANSALKTLSSNAGTLLLRGNNGYGAGVVLTTSTAYSTSSLTRIDYYGGDGGDAVAFGGALTNSGELDIGNTGLSANTTVSATTFANTGTFILQGSTAIGATTQAKLSLSGAASSNVTNFMRVSGDAVLHYGSGAGLASVAYGGQLELDGAQANISVGAGAQNSGVAHLASNAGTLLLRGGSNIGSGGVNVTLAAGLSNTVTGVTDVDYYGGDGGSALKLGGALVNRGAVNIGNTSLAAATLVQATALANLNALVIQGNTAPTGARATLAITGAGPSIVSNSLRIGGDATLSFGAGVGFSSIVAGGSLELDSAQASVVAGAGGQNSGIAKLANNAGTLLLRGNSSFGSGGVTLTTAASFTNSGTALIDYYNNDGGSNVTFTGAFVNKGTVNIGNDFLTATTTVTASSLQNTGSLAIQGSATPTGPHATLAITGAAPGVVTNFLRIGGDATLSFGSGAGLTSIAAGGGFLELDSAQASVTVGSGAQNSGLASLSSNAGTLLLRGDTGFGPGGVTLTTNGGFLNTGLAYVDSYANGDGGSSVTFNGGLVNEGTFSLGNGSLSAASTVSAKSLSNLNGQLNIQGGGGNIATMAISGSAVNDAAVNVGSSANLSVSGAYIQNGGVSTINGTLTAASFREEGGTTTVNGTLASINVADDGGLVAFNSALTLTSVAKTLSLANNSDLEFNAAVSASQSVTFVDASDELGLSAAASFSALIKGFANGDTIDLVNTTATSLTYAGGVLDLFNGSTQIAALSLSGTYTSSQFTLAADNHGGTELLTSHA